MSIGHAEFGIDELAQRAGTTVRQVRLYIERGLLPRPRRQGRTAYYTDLHVGRLQIILRLIGRGYTMAAIKELTEAWDHKRGLGDVLGLEATVTEPIAEAPRRVTRDDIQRSLPSDDLEAVIARAVEVGLIQPDEGEFVVGVPALLDAGAELVSSGIPTAALLGIAKRIRSTTTDLADDFVTLFLEHVWNPFVAAGQPDDQVSRVLEAIEHQRTAAARIVVAALDSALRASVDATGIAGDHRYRSEGAAARASRTSLPGGSSACEPSS